jgi:hypothetical protein
MKCWDQEAPVPKTGATPIFKKLSPTANCALHELVLRTGPINLDLVLTNHTAWASAVIKKATRPYRISTYFQERRVPNEIQLRLEEEPNSKPHCSW